LKNGVWVHALEYDALRRLVRVVQESIDAKTPGTAEWTAVREQLYEVLNVWLDVEDEDRTIKDLVRIEKELDGSHPLPPHPVQEGSEPTPLSGTDEV
jgi:hypothetical protein